MLNLVKQYEDNIVKSLKYIVEKDLNVDVDKEETEEYSLYLENLDFKYLKSGCERYVVFVGKKKFEIDFALSTQDAQYILKNIKNIKYLYVETRQVDSVFGNLEDLFNRDFIKFRKYEKFIYDCSEPFSKEEVLSFIERN